MSDYGRLNNWDIAAIILVVAGFVVPALFSWYTFGVAGVLGWIGTTYH